MSASDVNSPDFGATAGGGTARLIKETVWANPVEKVFDAVKEEPGSAKPDSILVATGVRRAFGGLVAVDVDHLEIQRGAITALIGPNGAGKTTFFNLLCGFDAADQGQTFYEGEDITRIQPHVLARRGVVRTFQLTKVLGRMTVLQNMMLGATHQIGESVFKSLAPKLWRAQEDEVRTRALTTLDEFNMLHMKDEFAGALSGGQRKLLEMARSLMADPKVIMLDEPMAGVNPALTQSLLGHVKRMRSLGITVVFVEHDMDVVREISDWVVVMAEGSIIAEGKSASIGSNQRVIEAYLGRSSGALAEER